MKKLFLSTIIVFLLFSSLSFAQNVKSFNSQKELIEKYLTERNEIYFKFFISSKDILKKLANTISIDNVRDNVINYEVFAYANRDEMYKFKDLNIDLAVLTPPSLEYPVKMSNNIDEIMGQWDVYPTYDAYINMMNQFATNYPNLCKIVNIGTTVNGRALLFAVISDSVNFRKPKPKFQYSSSIHGDEITGYVNMLRLIDTLLTGYGNNPRITELVKNIEIWINPLANPDGTYYGGNSTVNGARRANQNSIDLNRNFPDFHYGPNPTGTWQPETIAMMNLFRQQSFTLSMNFHGGAEVLNYPWDCESNYHPDDDWWIHISKTYVDTVHAINSSYLVDLLSSHPNIPGITNGYAWYYVYGGRQDFMTFANGGREITAEISTTKLVPANTLPNYWTWNHKSWLYYMKECLFGVKGIITDSTNNHPIKAKVRVQGREYLSDSTSVFSDSICGDYHRILPTGTYTLVVKAPGYITKTITGVYAKYDSTTILNIKLRPVANSISSNQIPIHYALAQNYPNPFNPVTSIKYQIANSNFITLKVFDILGKEILTLVNEKQSPGEYEIKFDASKLSSGIYFYKLTAGDYKDVKSMILIK